MKKKLITLTLVLFAFVACTTDFTTKEGEPSLGGSNPNQSTKEASEQRAFMVGDTVKVADLQFTITGTRRSTGSGFIKPEAGYEYLLIDVLVENVGDQTETISSLAMFSLYDNDGYKCDLALTDEAVGSADGTIIAGKHIRGELSYEVPLDSSCELQIDPTVFGLSGAFTVDLSQTSSTAELPTAMDTTKNVSLGTKIDAQGVAYTVNSFRTSTGSDFFKPKQGHIYYMIDIEVENNSDKTVPISSMIMFSLLDGEGYKQKIAIAPDAKGSVDGEVLPGKKLRGEIAYEVPIDAKGLEIWVGTPIGSDGDIFAVSLE